MPKKTEKELATVAVKLNFTPSEFALIEEAREMDDERRAGVWIRKASLRTARDRVAEKPRGRR